MKHRKYQKTGKDKLERTNNHFYQQRECQQIKTESNINSERKQQKKLARETERMEREETTIEGTPSPQTQFINKQFRFFKLNLNFFLSKQTNKQKQGKGKKGKNLSLDKNRIW
jgi:ribosomal protein L44E